MVNYKTTDDIVAIVYGLIKNIGVPVYRTSKPSTVQVGEYIVINALPINAYKMQSCRVNVNYHVKDLNAGSSVGYVPDTAKLNAGSQSVLNLLEKVTSATYMIDYDGQATYREEESNEHFSNLKFLFRYINS